MQIDDRLYDFAYLMAFRDATMRLAFRNDRGKTPEQFAIIKKGLFYECKSRVKRYIDDIFCNKKPKPKECIMDICRYSYSDGDDVFCLSFGNAQKLVNMTAKYMFLASYLDEDKREWFANCDCPMDGNMIRIARKKGNLKLNSVFSWSKMNEKDIPQYEKFQKVISDLCIKEKGILPIEFDYLYWDE